METFQNVLMKIGIFAGENKYLSSIKNYDKPLYYTGEYRGK